MSRITKSLIATALVGGLAAAVAYVMLAPPPPAQQQGGRRAAFKRAPRGPVPVIALPARAGDVPIYLEGLGTVRALNTVTVQPLVDGRLLSVGFSEGQTVRKGDILARIDPTLYQAQLDQANAKMAQDQAQLANARLDLDRKLKSRLASTQQMVDTARSLVAQLEALVKADLANVATATAQLGYTQIKAPIDGRTGIRLVDEGNVVRASANSAIVVITQIQPISVIFNLPQQQLGRINTAQAKGDLAVDALGSDGRTPIEKGRLRVVDNQVDQTTGTIRLKAEFANAGLQLWPGQFVNARLLIDTLRQVVIVPTAAVQQGPKGTFVFVVGSDNTVKVRPVEIGQRDDREAVVASGLTVSERVVTTGFARLRDGSEVAVSEPATSGTGAANPGQGTRKGADLGAGLGVGAAAAAAAGFAASGKGERKGKGKGRRARRNQEGEGGDASAGSRPGANRAERSKRRPTADGATQ